MGLNCKKSTLKWEETIQIHMFIHKMTERDPWKIARNWRTRRSRLILNKWKQSNHSLRRKFYGQGYLLKGAKLLENWKRWISRLEAHSWPQHDISPYAHWDIMSWFISLALPVLEIFQTLDLSQIEWIPFSWTPENRKNHIAFDWQTVQ